MMATLKLKYPTPDKTTAWETGENMPTHYAMMSEGYKPKDNVTDVTPPKGGTGEVTGSGKIVKLTFENNNYYIWRNKKLEARIDELEKKLRYTQQKCKRYQRAWQESKAKEGAGK